MFLSENHFSTETVFLHSEHILWPQAWIPVSLVISTERVDGLTLALVYIIEI
jgi:hypothetical protein